MSSSAPSTPFLAAVKDSSNMAAHSPLRSELIKFPPSIRLFPWVRTHESALLLQEKTYHVEQQQKSSLKCQVLM